MRIAEINGGVFGSTGRIMFGIADALSNAGHEVMCLSPVTTTNRVKEPDHAYTKIGGFRSRQLNVLLDRVTGIHGSAAKLTTRKMLDRLRRFDPDVIHLHVLHGSYVNLPELFDYLKKNRVKVIWTLHDCWAFTGHCPHYSLVACEKWKTGCEQCLNYRNYPKSLFDRSKKMYELKKKWFLGLDRLTLITPSEWLKTQVEQSFLNGYPVKVINNGIDLTAFHRKYSSFRRKYHCENQYLVLGVSFGWSNRKGLDVFKDLCERLPEDFRVVLVGTDERIDAQLPNDIISIHRTSSIDQLVEIYSACDVFVNPTREDTFPTVNIEALACGLPVITFPTGGSPEIIDDTCGVSVRSEDIDAMEREIIRTCTSRPYSIQACIQRASMYSQIDKYGEYVELIERL